jgi:GTP-binding protein HflX
VAVSARTGEGIAAARARIESELPRPDIEVTVLVPYERGDLVSRLHERGDVLELEHTGEGTRVHARVGQALAGELEQYTTE